MIQRKYVSASKRVTRNDRFAQKQAATSMAMAGRSPKEIKDAIPGVTSPMVARLRRQLGLQNWKRGRPGRLSAEAKQQRQQARMAVHIALRCGDLIQSPICQKCGRTRKTEGHHSNYDNSLLVEWLCRKCHSKITHA